jgi:hypothetical protein
MIPDISQLPENANLIGFDLNEFSLLTARRVCSILQSAAGISAEQLHRR